MASGLIHILVLAHWPITGGAAHGPIDAMNTGGASGAISDL
jgi:hypothetical protein